MNIPFWIVLIMVLTLLPIAVRAFALRPGAVRRWRAGEQPPLAGSQLADLAWWQKMNIALFVLFLLAFVASLMVSLYHLLPLGATQVLFAMYIGLGLSGLVHHFTTRCPRCKMNIGVQTSLVLPERCERCQVKLRLPGVKKKSR
jgi:hypothetical protein